MLVIAHRGNNKEALENSFVAYDLAVECGAHRIELDVQLTRDGHAVINHDDLLMSTTGLNVRCRELSRSDFENIRLLNGQPVPFLDQVVERYLSQIELNIEMKGNDPEVARAVVKVVQSHLHRDKIILSCFNPDPLIYVSTYLPDVQRACLVGDDDFPWPRFSDRAILNFMQTARASILHPRMDMMSEHLMDQATYRGWKIFTWSPMIGEDEQRESIWTALLSLGVHGHCTNFPRELRRWLIDNEQWNQRLSDLVAEAKTSKGYLK